ncbi:Serpentine Receptor, class I [Caenorhabditis elegans]|uniref:Serpentine Receptor, class I n=1 Tax=Caenorhabditis elegans TaxID=6239 RepID=G5EF52_CAEEL|nr:Serpentine Receptor, class I [Caenorhabditis elegans]CAB04621.2 Serpentine Receptor, class I [Caenorhabditis elegans]|eukprot:NP_493069.2 Serpentine Receptor, class I [Caenorhabditis elegans]
MPAGPPCPSSIPTYYLLTLHIIGGISIPINLIGFYLVWFQSPKMQGYKYCLCYLQLVSFIAEIEMIFICPAFYFFPLIGGFNVGADIIANNISSHHTMTLYVFVFTFELPSTLLCFIFRHNAAGKVDQKCFSSKYLKKFSLVLAHFLPFVTAFCFWNSRLTAKERMDLVMNNWPQCAHWLKFPAFEVYDYHLNPWLAVVGIGAFFVLFMVFSYCIFLGVQTLLILQQHRKSMSRQTYQAHKNALFSLVMQIVLPGVFIVVPLCICMFVVVQGDVHLQEFATDTMFFVSSHSMCSCIIMIISNPKYRSVLRKKILRILGISAKSKSNRRRGNTVLPSQPRIQ